MLFGDKINKLLIYLTTWINIKYIGLNETCHIQKKATYYMIAFMRHSGKGKTITTENINGYQRLRGNEWLTTNGEF